MQKVKLGIIGCGAIAPAYIQNFQSHFASIVEVVACGDLLPEAARKLAERFGISRAGGVEEVLNNPDIEIVVNLTNAWAHYEISMAALGVGKHIFTEKPLAVERHEGKEMIDSARQKGLLVAGAPDIFLGAGLQTCRRLLDEGIVGTPMLATALIALRYHDEKWLRRGTGPMFDMGPYYITALVALLGPVIRVTGSTATPFPVKPHPQNSPLHGQTFQVQTPTNVTGLLDFACGSIATLAALGEGGEGYVPRLEFYGERATLQTNDPNMYVRPAFLRGSGAREIHFDPGFAAEGRGLGVAEMAWALRTGRQPRANGELMYHALDIMHAVHESSESGHHIQVESACPRPEPFKLDEMLAAFQ